MAKKAKMQTEEKNNGIKMVEVVEGKKLKKKTLWPLFMDGV